VEGFIEKLLEQQGTKLKVITFTNSKLEESMTHRMPFQEGERVLHLGHIKNMPRSCLLINESGELFVVRDQWLFE